MSDFLRYFLPLYFVLFLGLAFFWRIVRVRKSSGHDPFKLGRSDSAHDFIGRLFGALLIAGLAVVFLYSFFPGAYPYALPVFWLEHPSLKWSGVILLMAGLIWMIIAQETMGQSWRIGVDTEVRTELVDRGLFRISRNPIFLGMRVILLGLFLALPNALTLVVLLLGEAGIQVQVRLEEQHLLQLHGDSYREYRKRTRRWI
jgi:protein-S-isoprenylcysteine O-methyltransferase Ste14